MSHVTIIAGPNGAGKTTSAPFILKGIFHVDTFVNADVIADFWQIIDNSETNQLTPIASGSVHSSKITVVNKMIWKNLMETYSGK